MKLSYNWLKDFVDLADINPEKLAEELTMKAFEVEEISSTGVNIDEKVVLGEILEITKHPDADKLNVTQTSIGSETLQIVCGGKNIKVGQKVPVALVGASVINRHDGSSLDIKKSKIRGVESFGMLCSADELGFAVEKVEAIKSLQGDGIFLLADSSNPAIEDISDTKALGTPIKNILNKNSDFVLEVGARSNRGDALSVYGQAREIATIFKRKLKSPNDFIKTNYTENKSVKSIKPQISTDCLNKDCSLFYTVAIEGIKVAESPEWLQERLIAQGQKSINNIVDISNYVMLELGQPMHFYDRGKISGDFLEVRRAKAGETITTLEKKDYELNEMNLVIADSKGPSSMAGAMGGLHSSISDITTNIVIEVAVFNPASVRKSARAAGIESESKRRFERGVDKAMSRTALLRAIELIQKISEEQNLKIQVGEILVSGDEGTKTQGVKLRKSQITRHAGIEIADALIIEILKGLGINLTKQDSESFEFEIPSHRQNDLYREIDLIEEIMRIHGFDKIQPKAPNFCSKPNLGQDTELKQKTIEKITQSFLATGFSEARLSSLTGDSLKNFETNIQDSIEMDNPLSNEHRILRSSLIPGLIQAAARNYAYDRTIDIKLFEIGKVYKLRTNNQNPNRDDCIEEDRVAAIFVASEKNWSQSKEQVLGENFFKLKTIIETLYSRAKFKNTESSHSFYPLVHPGIAALIEEDRKDIGFLAKLHPNIAKEWDLPTETFILELNFPKLNPIKFKAIPSTPIIERDITVDSEENLNAQEIIDLIKKNFSQDLRKITVVSLYQRDSNYEEKNNKSTSFRLKFQSESDTLTGEEIDKKITELKLLLETKLGVTFRA